MLRSCCTIAMQKSDIPTRKAVLQKPTMHALAEKWQPEIQLSITRGPIHDWYEGVIDSWFNTENGAYIDSANSTPKVSAPTVE